MSVPSLEMAEQQLAGLAQIDAKDAEIARLRARVAELEQAQKPIAFSEREPDGGTEFLGWTGTCWWSVNRYLRNGRDGFTHWLPMPPAPDGAA